MRKHGVCINQIERPWGHANDRRKRFDRLQSSRYVARLSNPDDLGINIETKQRVIVYIKREKTG